MSQLESVWPNSAVHAEYQEWSSIPLDDVWKPPQRMYIVDVRSFDESARAVADRFKRQQPVILNFEHTEDDLTNRMVDFCAGLIYALDGRMQHIVDKVLLLTPGEVEASSEEGQRTAERAFFNRL